MLESHEIYKNPDSIRHGTNMVRTGGLVFALLCATGIYWKKKKMSIPARSQYNVITLNQTVLLVILLQIDSMSSYLLHPNDQSQRLVFVIELLKIIFIENIFFKFLIPIYLLLCSRRHYPTLWVDRKQRKFHFFMTQPSFIARPVISKYQTNSVLMPELREKSPLRNTNRRPGHVIITIHAASDQGCSLPMIEN